MTSQTTLNEKLDFFRLPTTGQVSSDDFPSDIPIEVASLKYIDKESLASDKAVEIDSHVCVMTQIIDINLVASLMPQTLFVWGSQFLREARTEAVDDVHLAPVALNSGVRASTCSDKGRNTVAPSKNESPG